MEFTHTPARLQWFIAATGIIYFAFAYFVPTISAMRNWLATSAALTLAYGVTLLAILIRDGDHLLLITMHLNPRSWPQNLPTQFALCSRY